MESPHRNQPVLTQGQPLKKARGAVILLHGRGASAEDILGLQEELLLPEFAYLAPQAAGHTWYPNSFLAPIERNEPWLSSALELVDSILASLKSAGVPRTKVAILGFSQGACLARGALWRIDLVHRRADRAGRHTVPLPRPSERHALFSRRGRSRPSRSVGESQGVRIHAQRYGWGCQPQAIFRDGSYNQSG